MEAQLFAMLDSQRLAKDARGKNIVNDRVEMLAPAPSVGASFETRNFQSYSTIESSC